MTTRTTQRNVRLTDDEDTAIVAAAEAAGLSVSEWMRLVLVHAAGRHDLSEHLQRAERAVRRSKTR